MRPRTDFTPYSHGQLYQMLHHGDETTVRTVAESWDGVGARLHEQATSLERRLARFRQQWQGGAAEQYQTMIADLSAGLRRIGDAAFAMRDVAYDVGDALKRAKAQMPPPVEVPELSTVTVALATTPLRTDAFTSVTQVAELRQRQTDAAAELHRYEQAARAAGTAHARAVAVMNALAVEYVAAGDRIPVPPEGGDQTGGPGGEPVPGEAAGVAGGPDSEKGGGRPVFGAMFTAGVAAAAAAAAGRLGNRATPAVPGWAKKKESDGDRAGAGATPSGSGVAGLGRSLGGIGGGGGVPVGGGGGGGPAAPAPTAHGGLSGAGAAAGSAAAAFRTAAGAAGLGAGMTPMMPMMPMMPFAPTGGDAGARRVPPWLTETEEVWGESAVVTPPVLGADPSEETHPPVDFPY
ncbi:PPE domain-containing protein [Plantactinospora sp. B24E8]|uniref:WXG100 family type VII secretion target n=1 Tax=Plantactinospora sp. B24E8 TaxID=3153567 RepID=UPI00325C476A